MYYLYTYFLKDIDGIHTASLMKYKSSDLLKFIQGCSFDMSLKIGRLNVVFTKIFIVMCSYQFVYQITTRMRRSEKNYQLTSWRKNRLLKAYIRQL